MDQDNQQVTVADMCQNHQAQLCRRAGAGPEDPWRALIIIAQIALFQGMTSTPSVFVKIDNDLSRITELGCMACRLPFRFHQILREAAKKLGESWVKKASA